eukprot:3716580-Pyramimonas_sp.AAC.1
MQGAGCCSQEGDKKVGKLTSGRLVSLGPDQVGVSDRHQIADVLALGERRGAVGSAVLEHSAA